MPRAPSPPPPQTSPQHAGAAVAELFTVSGRNPFRVSGPAVVSFSGGRTSGMMLRKVLDAYGGTLPDDVHVVFTNTGAEDNRTLDFVDECARRWGVRVRWLEFTLDTPARYREVDYERADRAYGPFNDCIRIRSALPNGRMRFCTQVMKLGVLKAFMRATGYADDEWTNIVGLRADEIHRVMTLRARPETLWDIAAPLLDAGVTKPDVLRWWAAQPFDLATPEFAGNCAGCFLKGKTLRYRVEQEAPGALSWWAAQEAALGRTFIHKEPLGYAEMQRRVRLGILPGARIGAAGVASARVAGALDGGAVGAVGVCGFDDDELDADADDSVTCDCTG
jgi:3'-phosphoadenosine 5'-phosphosulfate sulfotransferase (PAPS reductase)/FAD synthetase